MVETEDQKRLRGVEEAVIEFKQIAKYVIGEHALRIKELEDDMDNVKSSIYDSCDLKTKEIDSKVQEASRGMFTWLSYLVVAMTTLAGLGLTAIIHFNDHVSRVETDVALIKTIQEHRNIQIADLLSKVNGIDIFLRKIEEDK